MALRMVVAVAVVGAMGIVGACRSPVQDGGGVRGGLPGAGAGVGSARGAGMPMHGAAGRMAVSADHPDASRAGFEILEMGGNAVDAAVATSFALSVVRPHSCGIGGGGFMVVHLMDDPRTERAFDPVTICIDYRERAPRAVGAEHFVGLAEDASRSSGHAVGVPGTVAGLLAAHERFGVLDLDIVMAPAIRLAREGFIADREAVMASSELGAALAEVERLDAGQRFLKETYLPNGALRVGDRIVNPAQAAALELIARDGADAFYRGPIGEAVVRAVRARGGVMTMEDLRGYAPKFVEPVRGEVFGRVIVSMPPPSSGGIAVIQILTMFESALEAHRPIARAHAGRGLFDHLLVESMKHAFADRARHLGDPEFTDVPVARMLQRERLRRIGMTMDADGVRPIGEYGTIQVLPGDDDLFLQRGGGTSHFSVIDADGSAVACTETINLIFGSRIAVGEYGFVLNNEMDDFLTRPGAPNAFGLVQGAANLPGPGKRPLSSMSPTIVLDGNGRTVEMVAGASGGPRIISGTATVLARRLAWGMDPVVCVTMARVHHQWMPDEAVVEPGYVESWRAMLMERGHTVREDAERPLGVVQFIARIGERRYLAVADPRKGGAPAAGDAPVGHREPEVPAREREYALPENR